MYSSFPAGSHGAVPALPGPFLHHMAKQSPWVALAGARALLALPQLPSKPHLPVLVQPGVPSGSHSPALCAAFTLLKDGCTSTPRPLSTLQLSLHEAGHSYHEPSRVPDSPLLLEKKTPKEQFPPKNTISLHQVSPSLAPRHQWHSKGELQRPEVAHLQRTLWLSCHLPYPGSNPTSPACN